MPYRRKELINGEIYHIVHRRIEGNLMFKDIDDYYRGIFSIYEFNNARAVNIKDRRKARLIEKSRERVSGFLKSLVADSRERLVNILCFCFMPNHIHLLVRQLREKGISKFMNKFGAGYPSYFYEKYGLKGKGYFFQGRFKSVLIKTEEQVKNIFVYIHANPLAITEPNWKEKGIQDIDRAVGFLEKYKWSSYLDYIGKKNFPSIIKEEKEYLSEIMGGEQGCREFTENWIRYKKEIKESNLILE